MEYRNSDGSPMAAETIQARLRSWKKREATRKMLVTKSAAVQIPDDSYRGSVEAYVRAFERANLLCEGDYGDTLAGMNAHAGFVERDLPVEHDAPTTLEALL